MATVAVPKLTASMRAVKVAESAVARPASLDTIVAASRAAATADREADEAATAYAMEVVSADFEEAGDDECHVPVARFTVSQALL